MARLISQVEDVAGHVVLCGEIGHYPRFIGSSHLQTTYRTVSALPAPAGNRWRSVYVCSYHGWIKLKSPFQASCELYKTNTLLGIIIICGQYVVFYIIKICLISVYVHWRLHVFTSHFYKLYTGSGLASKLQTEGHIKGKDLKR